MEDVVAEPTERGTTPVPEEAVETQPTEENSETPEEPAPEPQT